MVCKKASSVPWHERSKPISHGSIMVNSSIFRNLNVCFFKKEIIMFLIHAGLLHIFVFENKEHHCFCSHSTTQKINLLHLVHISTFPNLFIILVDLSCNAMCRGGSLGLELSRKCLECMKLQHRSSGLAKEFAASKLYRVIATEERRVSMQWSSFFSFLFSFK